MDAHVVDLLAELAAHGRAHDQAERDHGRKLLNLEPDTARLISILIQAGARRRLLEVGTSNGYSTIWLAAATTPLGGHVTSIDQSPAKLAMAAANLDRAGLRASVTLYQGDARSVLATLAGSFDLVLLDADRRQYVDLLATLRPRLAPGALLLADNAHSHPQEIAPYLAALAADPTLDHVVVGVGKGLSIAYKGAD